MKTNWFITPKHGIDHDWSFSTRLTTYVFLVGSNPLLMPFLVAYAMCSHIHLVLDAMY
jgi:hypothetical protein